MQPRKKREWTEEDIRLNEQTTTLTAQLHGLACPVCGNRKYAKRGKEKGNQRYKCNSCSKNFRSTTGRTIHHLHLKPKVQEYLECMNQGLSLRKTATKCDISLQTAFRWRHRFLTAMNKQPAPSLHENKVVSALVLPHSNKGKTIPLKKRTNITSILQLDVSGKLIIRVLGELGMPVNKFIGMAHGHISHIPSKSIPKFLKPAPPSNLTTDQVQKMQDLTRQIHLWLAKFRGVSSKYLSNYWIWFTHIRQMQLPVNHHQLSMYSSF